MRHRPGKVQTHVDGLSHLPVGPAPSEDTIFHLDIQDEEEARRLAQELHSATHLGGQALWKLFSDRYSHKAGRRICIEVAQSCPQCQRGSDYGHQQKTTGTIESKGPWDTLSVDIVGPLPANRRHEFIIVFVDCYSRFTILVPTSNHTADTVSDALLRHVVPYFGTPRRLLSDRGREFVGEVWGKLTGSLGIQRVLTSPYHPEGNSINERSHRTMNNMLRARLLRDLPSRKWVVEIPGIMLALNAMVHEPHGFSASMIATGREPSLPPDLESKACASPSTEDPVAYVEMIKQRLSLTHQQMTLPPAPETSNPYHEGDLIFVMTTPPERTSKLAPRWKGPFEVKRVPNAYQVTYEDDMVWRTVHVNHAKPAKAPTGGFPVPAPPPAPPSPPPEYLSRNYTWGKPAKPPKSATPTKGSSQPAAPTAEPTQQAATPQPASPPPGRPTTRSSANENSRLGPPLRRSERLKAASQTTPAHSAPTINMARTYPYSLSYDTCLGEATDPFSFSSVYIEDLSSGRRMYIKHVQQIVDLLPRTLDPSSRYTLRAHVTPPGHQKMRDSLRLALWCFLPRDGDFRQADNGLHYHLARQGRRVVLRGGNVTSPLHESRLIWIHDPLPRQTPPVPASHLPAAQTPDIVPRNNNTVPRNTVTVSRSNTQVPHQCDKAVCENRENGPRNGPNPRSTLASGDVRVRAPLDNMSASASRSYPLSSRENNCPPVPRNNRIDRQTDIQKPVSSRPKKKRINFKRRERRAQERREAEEAFNRDVRRAGQSAGAPSRSTDPDQLTPIGLQHSYPISAMRPAVYPPVTLEGRLSANDNSTCQFDLELGESTGLRPGLYKLTDPDPQHPSQLVA